MLNFKMQQSVIFSQRDAEMATLKKTGEQLEDLKLGPRFKSIVRPAQELVFLMSLQAYAADLCPYPHRGYPTFSDDQLEELM